MGLLDRDYYRDDEGGPLATWLRQGMVSKILVAVNIFVFVVQVSTQNHRPEPLSGPFNESMSLIGERVLHGEAWRLLTYGFLNPTISLLPVLFNIPLLWVVGHEVEERLGRRRFLAFYLSAIVVCGLAFVGAEFLGMNGATLEQTRVVGCTAALTAMLAWLTVQEPRLRLTFFYALTLPAWLVLIASVGMDVWSLLWPEPFPEDGRRITLAGHLGGMLFGMMFFGLLRARSRPSIRRVRRRQDDDPDLRIYRDESRGREEIEDEAGEPAPVPANPDLDEHLEAQLDAVLAKVKERGKDSLTPAEREILQRASEVYRKRRR